MAGAVVVAVLKATTAAVTQEYLNIAVAAMSLPVEVALLVGRRRPGRRGPAGTAGTGTPAVPAPRRAAAAVRALVPAAAALWLFAAGPRLLLMPAGFAGPSESAVGTPVLMRALGYATGLAIAAVTAVAVHRSAVACGPRVARAALTAAVGLLAAHQVLDVTQSLLARRLVPRTRWLFTTVVWSANHPDALLVALLAVAAALAVGAWVRRTARPPATARPAERRLARAEELSRRRFCALAFAGAATVLLTVTAGKAYDGRKPTLSPIEASSERGGRVRVSLSAVDDGHLHRFAHVAADGTQVRFIVIRKSGAAYGVGLDACQICGPTGYYERNGQVICKLCDVAMNIATIGFTGGCNPIPLAYAVEGGELTVAVADLEASAEVFA